MHIRINLALNTKNQISREACFLFCGYFPSHTITLGSSLVPFPIVSCSVIFGFTTPQVGLNVRFQTDIHVNYPLAIVLCVGTEGHVFGEYINEPRQKPLPGYASYLGC